MQVTPKATRFEEQLKHVVELLQVRQELPRVVQAISELFHYHSSILLPVQTPALL